MLNPGLPTTTSALTDDRRHCVFFPSPPVAIGVHPRGLVPVGQGLPAPTGISVPITPVEEPSGI